MRTRTKEKIKRKAKELLRSPAAWVVLVAIALAVALCASCVPGEDLAPTLGPTERAPESPVGPISPEPAPAGPVFNLTVNDAGDTLAVASGRVIGVGQTAGVQGRIVVPDNRTYGVVVGIEELACNGNARLVGILDDGTAGLGRSLAPSDALDGWFGGACQILAFRVPGKDGGRTYDFEILVAGEAPGTTHIKSYFEVQGVAGTGFRWATHSKVDVVP